jgi:hypothetical protein
MSEYKYQPLIHKKDIRLLTIEPGGREKEIACTMATVSLDNHQEFSAISYAWGNVTQKCIIQCDGKPLELTRSLYTALCYLRLKDTPRVLWADAICKMAKLYN